MSQILIALAVSIAVCSLYTFILPCYDAWVRRRAARTARQSSSKDPSGKTARQRAAALRSNHKTANRLST